MVFCCCFIHLLYLSCAGCSLIKRTLCKPIKFVLAFFCAIKNAETYNCICCILFFFDKIYMYIFFFNIQVHKYCKLNFLIQIGEFFLISTIWHYYRNYMNYVLAYMYFHQIKNSKHILLYKKTRFFYYLLYFVTSHTYTMYLLWFPRIWHYYELIERQNRRINKLKLKSL